MTAIAELPDLLTVDEAASALRIGRSAAYEMVRTKRLPAIKLGRTIRVPRQSIENLIADALGGDE